ncbi:MAG: HAD family hydrolase [Planctomycetota bacterium]
MDAATPLTPDTPRHASPPGQHAPPQGQAPFPPVAGALIDLCGVLYDDSIWSRWLFKVVQRLGLHTTYTPFFRVWRCEYLSRVKRQELEYWEALRVFLRAAGLSSGQIDEVEAAGHAQLRKYESQLMPLPGVPHVLTQLHNRGIELALLSSACLDTRGVHDRLDALGLSPYFSSVLSIPDLWRQYPEHPAFPIAARSTRLPCHRLAFVGRDTALLTEAGEAGMCRVAVNYDNDAVADVFLRGFDRLTDDVCWESVPPPTS